MTVTSQSAAESTSAVSPARKWAPLGDHYGRRKLFMTGIAVFTVTSALCAAAPSPQALAAFTFLIPKKAG